ncbi:hypothetical protein PHYSODRAFT_335928 [Phytophthora sojae]|uniref:Uncharacterized protein n=1 Tax=Phytophthora sojae (strain P6497) TaxID=1094619 RepID=G4ZR60_PHYSP|nr:hypothetical protein PHYSODRAFT_335928 [Phytophthora sojae]EGZ14282.1 hypothetical protein PHYSODRAFT_335928 [Phytophthora sojae]|eukprot:XP_009531711.1 hypothetical protein PHYSODRAFT_335928 [Phytophthora sojae]
MDTKIRTALDENLRAVSNEDDAEKCRPVVVFESITRAEFREWLDKHEGELRRWQYEPLTADSGRVVIYSYPTKVHNVAAGRIIHEILVHVGGTPDKQKASLAALNILMSPMCDVGDRDQEPDGGLKPRGAQRWRGGHPTSPTLIVEVAYKNESWGGLVLKLRRWMSCSTAVQVAIGVKVYRTRRRIILIQRNADTIEMDFVAGQEEFVSFPLRHANNVIAANLGELGSVIDEAI